jgi:hypothetical protein
VSPIRLSAAYPFGNLLEEIMHWSSLISRSALLTALLFALSFSSPARAQYTGFATDAQVPTPSGTARVVSSVYVNPNGSISTYRLNIGVLGGTTGFYGWVSSLDFLSDNEVQVTANGFWGRSRAVLYMYLRSDGANSAIGFRIVVNGVNVLNTLDQVAGDPVTILSGRVTIVAP